MKIDIDAEKRIYDQAQQKLIDEYGDASRAPKDQWYLHAERLRAAYSLHTNPEVTPQQIFKVYSIDHRVWSHFVDGEIIDSLEKRTSRAEKIQSVLTWASENVGEQITLETLQNTHNIAYTMAKKIVEDRPDVFRRLKRGLFEVRNPEADRKADKEAAKAAEAEIAAEQTENDDNDDNDNEE